MCLPDKEQRNGQGLPLESFGLAVLNLLQSGARSGEGQFFYTPMAQVFNGDSAHEVFEVI